LKAIEEAEQRLGGSGSTSDAQQKLTQSQAEARNHSSAEENAQAARELFWRGQCRISNACKETVQDLNTEREGDR